MEPLSESEPKSEPQKLTFKIRPCQGCVEDQPNQLAHHGGCLPDLFAGETWDDMYELQ